jgi:hypothetical protein
MALDPKSNDELKRIYREIAGTNPSMANVSLMDEEDQRVFIAKTMQQLMLRTHPMVLMTMLIVALGYMSDEHNVDREHLVKLLREARQTMQLAADIKPGG